MNGKIVNFIKKNEVMAIIPARSGSKGVKNKNIRCISGYPMIAYSIVAAKLSDRIGRVVVSTDSEYYADIANYYGAEVPFLRPNSISMDTSTDLEFIEHIIENLFIKEKSVPEYFVHLRPTYPLRDVNEINRAIQTIMEDSNATSLRSAYKADVSPFKWFQKDGNYFKPMYDYMTLDDANRPRQSYPEVYIPDGYVDVLKVENVVLNNNLHGTCMLGFIVEKGIDVDNYDDMEKVENLIMSKDFPVLTYLNENFKKWEKSSL